MTETNQKLAALFHSIANLLDAQQSNAHRIRAYRRAARSISTSAEDIGVLLKERRLTQLSGIGKDLSAKIEEFIRTGTIQTYEQLTRPLPPDIAAWEELPGFSAPTVQELYHRLGIRTIDDLEALVRSHLVQTLPGVTLRDDQLLAGIAVWRARHQAQSARPSLEVKSDADP